MATQVPNRMIAFDGGNFAFRNKIINGNFDIWQRGTTFTNPANLAYLADRWTLSHSAGTRVISQQPFFGQTDPPGNPIYFLRWQQTTSSPTAHSLAQKIESVQTLANKQIALSFYAKADSSINVSVNCIQYFGSGGSPIASAGTSTINVTTTWQKYTVNFTTPPLTSKILGTNDRLDVLFSLPIGSTFTFDIAQVQLEEGSFATPFEQRPIGTELALCQRYYEKSYDMSTAPGTVTNSVGPDYGSVSGYATGGSTASVVLYQNSSFKVTKRATPTVTLYSGYTSTPNRAVMIQTVNGVTTRYTIDVAGFVAMFENGLWLGIYPAASNKATPPLPNDSQYGWSYYFTADAEL